MLKILELLLWKVTASTASETFRTVTAYQVLCLCVTVYVLFFKSFIYFLLMYGRILSRKFIFFKTSSTALSAIILTRTKECFCRFRVCHFSVYCLILLLLLWMLRMIQITLTLSICIRLMRISWKYSFVVWVLSKLQRL